MDEDAVKHDLITCYQQSTVRGLKQSAKWAAELLHSISKYGPLNSTLGNSSIFRKSMSEVSFSAGSPPCDPDYYLAKSCFDLFEYDRAAHFAKNSSAPEAVFLYFYGRYMSAEKKRLDLMAESNSASGNATATSISVDVSLNLFSELRVELSTSYLSGELNDQSYILYVYAIVLLKLDLNTEAMEVLCRSVKADTLNWASWHQLALIIDDKSQLDDIELPSHWFKKFFLGAVYLELQLNDEALSIYDSLLETFKESNYIFSQVAIAKHNLRDVDGAIDLFKAIRESDPMRLDAMDIYSNLLYVKDMRADLSSLAHSANNVEPFRVETCCCIANFYSLRGQHAKAVVYFTRALQLNPRHLSAWTLMGHEYMEMKNTGAAIQAYRSAIKCNKRDYRAWYGLGQTYEILKMPTYCLYYYTVARSLRPNDSRMMIATGETLEKLERNQDALKCYWKAGGIALIKLAALYEKTNEKDKAAAAYTDFISKATAAPGSGDELAGAALCNNGTDLSHAYKFLANYYVGKLEYKSAYAAAQKCVLYPDTRDEGKQILKQILTVTKNSVLEEEA